MGINYDLPKPTPGSPRSTSPTETEILRDVSDTIADAGSRLDTLESATSGLDELWLPASGFGVVGGSPIISGTGGRAGSYQFDASSDERIGREVDVAAEMSGWATFDATLYWHNPGVGTGDVRWQAIFYSFGVGDTLSVLQPYEQPAITVTAGGQYVVADEVIASGIAVPADGHGSLVVRRVAADDTLTNDAALQGVLLTKVT